jgi:hypothetical protein
MSGAQPQRAPQEQQDPHGEVPADARGVPDDRFDGTDSGPDGWDTPYPPVDPDSAPSESQDEEPDPARSDRPPGSAATVPERTPSVAVDGTSYETDGPDDPADTPQR